MTIFVIGVLTGALGLHVMHSATDRTNKPKQTSSPSAPRSKAQQESHQKRLDKRLETTKARIAKDVAAGRLTEQQARLINTKLAEIVSYQKVHARQSSSERKDKRQEWRKWAEQNKVPTVYVLQVL